MTDIVSDYCLRDVQTIHKACIEYEKWTKRYHELVLKNENLIYYVIKGMGLYKHLDDFYDIGMIGLCKAARSFDVESGIKFSTYAITCIKYEIHRYGRKKENRKWNNISSLDIIIDDNKTTAVELIADDVNIEEDIIRKELYKDLYKNINKLSTVEQLVINYSYGLNGYTKMSQHNILILLKRNYKMKYNYSQSYISRIKTRAIKKLKRYLKDYKEI